MAQPPLCVLPPDSDPGCCAPAVQPPAAPVLPVNPPGLSAIRYRIGTFTSFRRAMLDRVPSPDLLGPGTPSPFAGWHEGTAGDYQTALIELWAYLADILTFYQERIANEALLPTAIQRDSLRRLAELIGYRARPGAAASALLALTVEKGRSVAVPAGFRIGSRAAPGKPAAVFETDAALGALGDYSAIPMSSVAPTNQFGALGSFGIVFGGLGGTRAVLASGLAELYGSAAASFFGTVASASARTGTFIDASAVASAAHVATPVARSLRRVAGPSLVGSVVSHLSGSLVTVGFGNYRPFIDQTTRSVVLQGIVSRLAVGDHVLLVENEGSATDERTTLQQLTAVDVDSAGGSTAITWKESTGVSYQNVTLYALRVTAGAFGNNAPNFAGLPASLTGDGGAFHGENWDDSTNDWFYLPTPGDSSGMLFLDAVHDAARGTPSAPGWAALLADGASQVFHVTDARPLSKAAYAISARATRLTFGTGEALPAKTFPLRGTVVLAGSERLTLRNDLPLPDPLAGDTLVLAGLYPKLQAGQTVVVRGNVFDPTTTPPSQVVGAESGILLGPPALDAADNLTTVTLRRPLGDAYVRATTVLLANVVPASQGETVRDEVLGSGDGTANQAYPLKQKPLTYLPSTDPEGLAAVASTLTVTVNGVRWREHSTLLESAPNAQDFTTTQDDTGQTTVVFGDGTNGARPPTGRANVHARYRKGLGTAGNLPSDGIQQLIDGTPGLQKATNPQPSYGGSDPDGADQIRVRAPASVRTFDRAVSAADYSELALEYPGVAKASAARVLRDPVTLQTVAQPYILLTVATADRVPLAQQVDFARKLRGFLDRRRDPNVPLRLGDVTPVYVDVAATIEVDDRYGRQATFNAVLAAMNPGLSPDGTPGYFAFERLDFGESVHLSAVYAALQSVPGVRGATITTLRRLDLDPDPATVRDDIFIRPTQLAVVLNDPADAANEFGKLAITLGQGGFVDL